MHCRTCDYPLWNLTTLKCPECGEAYRPSDYEFVPNSVRFCCPHCQQAYYGTDKNGHLEPAEFTCIECSNQIHMDQMVLLPAEGVKENWTKPDVNPWLERKSRGLFKAWLASVSSSLVRPSSMMKSLGDVVRVGEAWKFALLNLAIIVSIGIGLPGSIIIFFQFFGRSSTRAMAAIGSFAVVPIVYALIYILGLLLWAAIAHGILRLTKSANHSFGKTVEAILYSSGVMAPTALPFVGIYCGTYVTLVWWIVSAVIMVTVGHKAKGVRPSLAVIAFPSAVFLVLVASYIGIFYFAISQTGGAFNTARIQSFSANSVDSFSSDILTYSRRSNGAAPAHSILLLENPNSTSSTNFGRWIIREDQFVGANTTTIIEDIPVGDITLEEYQTATITERKAAVKKILESMPDNVVAHRFGDYVFTYHGINTITANPGLWLVVFIPDPDSNTQLQPYQRIEAGLADGTTHAFRFEKFAEHLQSQNELRATVGLPPLPDLMTVTHSKPAVAESGGSSD